MRLIYTDNEVDDGIMSIQFEMDVGVHQGSVLSPLMFIGVMDVLTEGVRGVYTRLMYAVDVVFIGESMEEATEAF